MNLLTGLRYTTAVGCAMLSGALLAGTAEQRLEFLLPIVLLPLASLACIRLIQIDADFEGWKEGADKVESIYRKNSA